MADLMDTLEYAHEWLEFAEMDVNSAEYLMNMRPRPDEIICYHCQQSAEKSLKGFLVINDITPPKIHNLLDLCGLCVAYNAEIKNLLFQLEYLNQFSVTPRYPRELTLTDQDAQNAIDYAKIVFEFIKTRFSKQ
ncbi:MAG: HEPN domain-containing protein, partial [Treponema sp.]|nr:HEPN domain-containing protein [Treponema sp.]